MIVLRSTMQVAVEAERAMGWARLREMTERYGEALNRVTALQQQMSAWLLKEPGNITPEQMAQMFYAQDDRWQAAFFNCMSAQVEAHHASLPEKRPGEFRLPVGVPAGEQQWYFMGQHLTGEGFATLEAMFDHALHHREEGEAA